MNVMDFVHHIGRYLQDQLGDVTEVITEAPERNNKKSLLTWVYVNDLWPEPSKGYELNALELNVSILSLCHRRQPQALLQSVLQASQMVHLANNTNWTLPKVCERTRLVRSERDSFQPDLPDYYIYHTQFQQVFYGSPLIEPKPVEGLAVAINPKDTNNPDDDLIRFNTI